VRAVLRGARRSTPPPTQRTPLRARELVAGLPRAFGARADRDRALLLIGWSAALRRAELVALDVADVETNANGLLVRVRHSKTSNDPAMIPIPRGQGTADPVDAWCRWRARLDGDGAAFRAVTRHGRIGDRLSGGAVGAVVAECALKAGLTGNYGAHSLRAGWITEAATAGTPEWRIMLHSRHSSSDSVRGYVRPATIWQGLPSFL
jgi:integrase